MGLTIHYELRSKATNVADVRAAVGSMRELAMDLPFEEVGDVVAVEGEACNYEARRDELQKNGGEAEQALFWLLIQSSESVRCPWNRRLSRSVSPTHVIAFNTWPGHGCESANFGLCLYPSDVEWEYRPEDDQRFQRLRKGEMYHTFDWDKWDRHRRQNGLGHLPDVRELRKVPTGLKGWYWSSFCKTQYASDPECGGLPNFLRCHISVITLLERIAKLPGVNVRISDEGHYGPHHECINSNDYRSGKADKPICRRVKGRYCPAVLAKTVGGWNERIAALAGLLSDAISREGVSVDAPIKSFADFEQLEFRGRQKKDLEPFLNAMKAMSESARS